MLTSFWTIKEDLEKAINLLEKGQQLEAVKLLKQALKIAKIQCFEHD